MEGIVAGIGLLFLLLEMVGGVSFFVIVVVVVLVFGEECRR